MISLKSLIAPSFYSLYWDVTEHNHSNYWLKGGRGSTKSSFVSLMIILKIMEDPEANAIVLRKVATTLRESVYDQYLWAIDKLGVSKWWDESISPMVLTYTPTGQQIRFKGADKPEKIKSQKFRLGYMKYKHFEELTNFSSMKEIRNINQSLNRGGSGITTFYSYNPPESVNSWVNEATETQKFREDTLVHNSDYRSVPKEWLGKEFLADAEQLKNDNPTAYDHDYLGIVTGTGAEVFTNVKLETITDEDISHFDNLRYGLDYGFASDPLAFEAMHYDKTRRILYFFGEVYRTGMKNRDAVKEIKKFNPHYVTSDREPRTVAEFKDLGLNVKPAKKGKDSRSQGFKWLQDLRAIVIDPTRCPNTAREFTTYELKRDATGNFKAEFPDGNDHSIDSSRYGLEADMKAGKGGFIPWS